MILAHTILEISDKTDRLSSDNFFANVEFSFDFNKNTNGETVPINTNYKKIHVFYIMKIHKSSI